MSEIKFKDLQTEQELKFKNEEIARLASQKKTIEQEKTSEVESLNQQLNHKSQQLNQSKQKIQILEDTIKTFEEQLKESSSTQGKESDLLQGKLTLLESNLKEKDLQIVNSRKEIQDFKKKVSKLESDVRNLQSQLDDKIGDQENVNKMLLMMDKSKTQESKEKESLNAKIQQLQEANKKLVAESDSLKLDAKKYDGKIGTLNLQIQQKDQLLKIKDQRIDVLESKVNDLQKVKSDAKTSAPVPQTQISQATISTKKTDTAPLKTQEIKKSSSGGIDNLKPPSNTAQPATKNLTPQEISEPQTPNKSPRSDSESQVSSNPFSDSQSVMTRKESGISISLINTTSQASFASVKMEEQTSQIVFQDSKTIESEDSFSNWQESLEDYQYKKTNQIKTGLKDMARLELSYKKDELIVAGNGILILKVDNDVLSMAAFDKQRAHQVCNLISVKGGDIFYHEKKTNNLVQIGRDLVKKKSFPGVAGPTDFDEIRNSRFYNDSKKCLWLMGGNKIGIFTLKKMENKAIPGFFGEAAAKNTPIGCVYNKDANWLAGISNLKDESTLHLYKKGQNIQHIKLSSLSQGKDFYETLILSVPLSLYGAHPRKKPRAAWRE